MSNPRAHRLATTFFVVLALLFSQLALAGYVCPSASSRSADAGVMEMAPGQPCEGMDMAWDDDQPVLCHQHCSNAPQSFDPMQVPVASLPVVVQVLVLPLVLDAAATEAVAVAQAARERPPPDPLFLATLRLRV